MVTQNVYEYNKVKPINIKKLKQEAMDTGDYSGYLEKAFINKINELTIEQNHLMKDFELYKKSFKHHVGNNQFIHD